MNAHDPIRSLEHEHRHLTKLALGIGEQLRDRAGRPITLTSEGRREVLALLQALRDELLEHFADEEEALFPFVRRAVPGSAGAVDRLEAGHDAICGAVVRLAHLASQDPGPGLLSLYERFEVAYSQHSRDEAELFDSLGRQLGERERGELASLLQSLSQR